MENKVYVFTKKQMCDICRAECAEQDGLLPDCDNCTTKYLPNMDRAELTGKIAKALCISEGSVDCETCIYRGTKMCETQLNNWYLKSAEIVLNALLGEE